MNKKEVHRALRHTFILSEFINGLFLPYQGFYNKNKQKKMQSSQITPFEIS